MRTPTQTMLAWLSVLVTTSAAIAQPTDAELASPPEVTPAIAPPGTTPPSAAPAEAAPPYGTIATVQPAAAAAPGAVPATVPTGGSVEDALLGERRYARQGLREIGGSAGLMLSGDLRNITLAPSIGWFIAESLELSVIASVTNVKADETSATMWAMLAEPSYHLPFNPISYGFIGMGVGAAYEEVLGAGLAVAPRVGANFLVGASGVLTPSLQYQYVTHNNANEDDAARTALTSALQFNFGYKAMW